MADLSEGEIVQCGRCQSLHDFETVLDSDLDYYAVCESFVAACPRCTEAIVLAVGDVGGAVSVGHVRGYGARPDLDCHQHLSVPSLFSAFTSVGPVLCYRGRVWLPGARAAGFPATGADLPRLARLARDTDAGTRRTAVALIRVAGRNDPNQAAAPLLQSLHDGDPDVALAAASALVELAPNAARSEANTIIPLLVRAGSEAELAALGEPALRVALGLLGDAGPAARRLILRSVGACGLPPSEAVDAVVRALTDEDAAVRREAVVAARRLGVAARPALPALAGGLWSADGEFRKLCLIAMGEVAGSHAAGVTAVTEALGHPDPEVRREAARVLGGVGPAAAAALPSLVRLLSDAEPSVRVQAAYAIGTLGLAAGDAVPELRRLLHDPHPRVRWQAGVAIRQVEGGAPGDRQSKK
jgi:HEAT repeat protein